MKKAIVAALALTLAFTTVGCSGKKKEAETEAAKVETEAATEKTTSD